ncbi:MAG: DNA cytosine methyltransferase [Solirubrobacterales bacterium]
MNSLELFAGAGGLALGISNAGFNHKLLVEWDNDACNTIRLNQRRGNPVVMEWPLVESDVALIDFTKYTDIDLLAGGPPCQPFSVGGKHRGNEDHRNMFPQMIRAIRELRPRVVVIENVKGLLRETFSRYFEYILLQVTYPELTQRKNEQWTAHLDRLERHHTQGRHKGLSYNVVFRMLNAADYGVPQKRERVFIVGFRNDLGIEWAFPEPTHSYGALLWSQYVSGEYWDRHRVRSNATNPQAVTGRIRRLKASDTPPITLPWRTVRDALVGLPDPERVNKRGNIMNHEFRDGARAYHGHTGSPMDEPAKTLKAGDHGVPGGENMVVKADGSVRYFTVRESARLQTFPDDFAFDGSWSESMRQIGNAVPVRLGEIVVESVRRTLEGQRRLEVAQ